MKNQVELAESRDSCTIFCENDNGNKGKIQRFFSKLPYFFKQNYGFFVIPLFVFLVFTLAFIKFEIWPFGTSIIASYDMLAQVCPILEHFFDVLQGESGLFHTFHIGSGMDMFGILAYCAISPFTFLFLLAGSAGSLLMVSIVLPIKFACIGISAFIFLRIYFKNFPQYVQVVLALLYAYSGYAYVANTYIIWMDIMMYMPLLGAGIIEFSKKGSVRLMVIGLALNIYACFSIVCFSFFTLFPILVCYVIICKERSEWREFLSKLCIAFVLAVGIALPVLVPSLMAYTKAGRNTGLFSRVFEIMSESKVLEGELNLHLYEKFSYIFCDSTFIAFTITYFMRTKKGDKLARFLLVAFVFLLLPCFVDESMLLLNMGSYYSYALRFGFLISFYFLFISAKAIEQIIEDKLDERKIDKVKSNLSIVLIAVITTIAVLFTFGFFNFILNGKYENSNLVKSLFGSNSESKPFEDFFPLFAHSEGGCEGTAVLFIVVLAVFLLVAILVWAKCVKIKDIACYVCILGLSQTVFFNFALVKGNRQSGSYQKFDYYSEMIDEIAKIEEDEYYRLKNFKYYISSDSPLILGNYSNMFFSSMTDAKNITAAKFFGYGGSHTNSTRSNGGITFSDSLLNYKYIVFEPVDLTSADRTFYTYTGISAHKTPSVKVSYVVGGTVKTATWEDISREKHGKGKWSSLTIKIAGNSFSGYLGDELIYTLNMDSDKIKTIKAVNKNAYGSFKELSVKNSFGQSVEGDWEVGENWQVENGVYTSTTHTNSIKFTGETSNASQIQAKVLFTSGVASSDYIGIAVVTDKGTTYRIVIEPNVGYMVYKNEIAFSGAMVLNSAELDFDGKTKQESYQQLANMLTGGNDFKVKGEKISIEETKQLYKYVKDKGVDYTLVKNGIKVAPITAEKGQMLFLSYVNLDGYKVYINGEERQFKENSLDLMMVDLDEGVNVVEIKYTSPYFKFILIGLVLAGLIVLLCYLAYKKKPIIFNKASLALSYMAIALAVMLTLFFFVYPTFIYAKKFFGTYIKYLM